MHDIVKVLFRVFFCLFDGEFRARDELDDSSFDSATVNNRVFKSSSEMSLFYDQTYKQGSILFSIM